MAKTFTRGSLWCAIFAIAILLSCNKPHHTVTPAFYYWKTSYQPTAYETAALHQLGCRRMYLRLFDVDWDYPANRAMPVAPIALPTHMDTAMDYVPVIFITQRTLLHISDSALPTLAQNIASYTGSICSQTGIAPKEIQMDCDWSSSTKHLYFRLLTLLRQQPVFQHTVLSCTIRLHQVKYVTSNGVPPVDRGMLMCYNMGNMKKPNANNSIMDVEEAKLYLKNINTYPLKLDIALPLFGWCLQFRGGQFKGILRDVQPEEVRGNKLFTHEHSNRYHCNRDTLYQGYYLKNGDELRVEQPAIKDIQRIAAYTAQRLPTGDINVVFFHCDSITLSKYPVHELEKVVDTYR